MGRASNRKKYNSIPSIPMYMLREDYLIYSFVNSIAGAALDNNISIEDAITRYVRTTYPKAEQYSHLLLDGKSPQEIYYVTLDAMERVANGQPALEIYDRTSTTLNWKRVLNG